MADILSHLRATLDGAYDIERELGGGGMSRVFVATDRALGRRVVVKVLTPEMSQGLNAERFAREIRLVAALQDTHIVPVLTAGTTTDGMPYFTMPFVEGETLRARMLRGPLSLDEVLRVVRDMAEGLEYAHARGVVHRDIKPENVLLSGRAAVVADFGIAKALSAARTENAGATLTSMGVSLGTPAYIAPEQAMGDPVDHRADIYSWGMVAYELLAGQHPFVHKTTAQQLMAAQMSEMPATLHSVKPALPLPLGALVMQCISKNASDRPASATEMLAALAALSSGEASAAAISGSVRTPTSSALTKRHRQLIGAGAVIAVVAVGGAMLARRIGAGASETRGTASLAVLPFEHQGDTANVYLTDGITDEIRGKLTGVPGLIVIARGSSTQYRATTKAPKQIAQELGVRYLLTGTVRVIASASGNQLLVRPELVEITSDGQPQSVWQAPFDASAKDVIRVQADIAGRVADAMQLALGSAAQAKLASVASVNPDAYDAYLRAQTVWNDGASSEIAVIRRALILFKQAVSHDSSMVDAWGALSRAYSRLYGNGIRTREIADSALRAANRAIAIDPAKAAGHWALSAYRRSVTADNPSAFVEANLAVAAAPSNAAILSNRAVVESELGKFNEALSGFDEAVKLDPRSIGGWLSRTRVLMRLRRIPEARVSAERAQSLAPAALNALLNRVCVELAAGDTVAARREIALTQREVPRERVAAYLARYWDLAWVLTPEDQRLVLSLGPDAFDNNLSTWGSVRTQLHQLMGNNKEAHAWGDSTARFFEPYLKRDPESPEYLSLSALTLAHTGRKAEALARARRAVEIEANTTQRMSATAGYHLLVVARAAAIAGDRDQSLEWLHEMFARRWFTTPAWIRLDPMFKSLRGDPRFEQLLAQESK